MRATRRTLAGLLVLAVTACTESPSPTQPGAPMLHGSPGAFGSEKVYTDAASDAVIPVMAARFAAAGHPELATAITASARPRFIVSCPSDPCDKGGDGSGGANGTNSNFGNAPGPVGTPASDNPSSRNAVIFSSATTPYISGTTGMIVSWMIYFGNMAVNKISYRAEKNATTVASGNPVSEAEGDQYPSVGSGFWDHLFTFRHSTTVTLNNLPSCGVSLTASGDHEARFQTPGASLLGNGVTAARWGATFAVDAQQTVTNGSCPEDLQKRIIGTGRDRGDKGGAFAACQSCIHWGVFRDNVMVDDYWECQYVPKSMCGFALAAPAPEYADRTKPVAT